VLSGLQGCEDIIPDRVDDEPCLGSLKGSIMLSGISLLHTAYEFYKFSFYGSEILELDNLMSMSRVLLYKLFVHKQRILNNKSNDAKQLKLHICGHMVFDVCDFTSRLIDDTSGMEHGHQDTKNMYSLGSRRISGLTHEMYVRKQDRKILGLAHTIYSDQHHINPEHNDLVPLTFSETHHRSTYVTDGETSCTFEASYYSKDYEEVVYDDTTSTFVLNNGGNVPRFLSSFLSLHQALYELQQEQELIPFFESLQNHNLGSKLRLHRFLHYDGSSQGIPRCTIYAHKNAKRSQVGGSAVADRFDWVNILLTKGRKVTCIYETLIMMSDT
jgi:hypothetical protein